MYWGRVSPEQDKPNQGYETGNIYQPIWYQADKIAVRSAQLDADSLVRGIFDIEVDPSTLGFRKIHTLAFPYLIRDFDYDPISGRFAITFSKDAANIQTVRANAAEPALAVIDTVLNEQWFPRAARFWGSDLLVYAQNPTTFISGFYFVPSAGTIGDSLVLAADLSIADVRGFDVAGNQLCYGVTESEQSQIFVMDLTQSLPPRRVATIAGEFVSASLNASGTCAVVSAFVYQPNEAGNIVGLLNIASGSYKRVDVRTQSCGYVTADFAYWNPTSNGFAFSAGGFTGESEVFPRQLWARKNVQCP